MAKISSKVIRLQVSPPRGKDKRQWRATIPSLSSQPSSSVDWAWLVKRLHKLCMDLSNNYIQMHLDLESSLGAAGVEEAMLGHRGGGGGSDSLFFLPLFPSESSTPTPSTAGGPSGRGTPSEDGFRCHPPGETPGEEPTLQSPLPPPPSAGIYGGSLPHLRGERGGSRERSDSAGRKKEWWESAGNKLYTIATDRTITKFMIEYKRRKQQQQQSHPVSHAHVAFSREAKPGDRWTEAGSSLRDPESPGPQRPQQLVDQGPMRHSFSAGPEILRQEKRPRSASMASSHNISLRDAEAQIQVSEGDRWIDFLYFIHFLWDK